MQNLSDSGKFWKAIKPYLTGKGLNSNKLHLKEKGNLVSNEKQLVSLLMSPKA